MSQEPSINLRLYGTESGPAESRIIDVGPLSFVLQSGALRQISIGGIEAIRGIGFVVRDKNWGTYLPEISGLEVVGNENGIRISYCAECRDADQALGYQVAIEGSPDGTLEFTVTGAAKSDFLTSRTGFVVLHPLEGVAGHPVTVTHTDGSTRQANFPGLISPAQPFFDIRALSHQLAPGLTVTCTMEGDAFEMEDQRNWSDASYKTYIRPLSKPRPYVLEAGKKIVQRVSLKIEGRMQQSSRPDPGACCTVSIKKEISGRVPEIALAVNADFAEASIGLAGLVKRAGAGYLVCTFDAAAGHGVETMKFFRRMGEKSGAKLILEAVLPLQDSDGQFTDAPGVLEDDIAAIRHAAEDAGVEFAIISVSPACYSKSYQPIDNWPVAPPLRSVYAATRQVFPGAELAGGMHSYFTELNRFRPPTDAIDIITHSTCPIVHAADDVSVMESLQALPWIFRSAKGFSAGKRYWIGPTSIAMRMNPYGAGAVPNPHNVRVAMAVMDPRQRGLFNAAWTLGYASRAATGGVTGLCLSAVAGPNAFTWRKMDWDQPWFDQQASENPVFPVYHVIAGLARRAGAAVLAAECSDPAVLAALAIEAPDGRELWLANLTAQQCHVELQGIEPKARVERLDVETFRSCCARPNGLSSTARALDAPGVTLEAYAVLRISNGSRSA